MICAKKVVNPLLTHWSYNFLALTHQSYLKNENSFACKTAVALGIHFCTCHVFDGILTCPLHWCHSHQTMLHVTMLASDGVMLEQLAEKCPSNPSYAELFDNTVKSLTHWGRDKMDTILQPTFSNAFSWIKTYKFRLRFHWSLFLRVQLTIY